ncbi:MAG: OPT family oligopeptide transporter [Terriglobia bacterium]
MAEPTPPGRGWSSTAPPGEFKSFIAPQQSLAEFTLKAVILGAFFGLAFGAVTVYLALRAGLTVSASIPIAVLAIAIFKRFGATILENNIVQTAGSAGESIAAGVVFTLPALIFLGYQLEISRIFWIALIGGCLGVLFMIPLRRYLVVKEHGTLTYPEGTACADVLVAGERGGRFAGRVFWGFALGALYKFFNEGLRFWKATPTYAPAWYPGSTLAAAITPEYLGVGFILGIRIGGIIVAGSVLSWLVLIPMIKFFGQSIPTPIFPSTVPISEMDAFAIWDRYIRPIGAGAVAMAGLITLIRTMPTIIDSLRAALGDLFRGASRAAARTRTERDLPLGWVFVGSVILVLAVWAFLWKWELVPGLGSGFVSALLVVVFGFLFVTVSSRIVGIIGSSSNPISGMTIATLMATSLLFLAVGWTGGAYAAVALSVGAVVCIASANAGATSQDLKTGFLVGATPWRQQVALIVGVLASVAVIGWTVTFLNEKYTVTERREIPLAALPAEARVVAPIDFEGGRYQMITIIGSAKIPDGTYYYSPEKGMIEFQRRHGIGSIDMPAPQAVLMATVINGILKQSLPWGLVLLGVFIVLVMELSGVRSLAFAVGTYLPISTTLPIFFGGVVNWLVQKSMRGKAETGEVSSGALFGAGLIAGGSIAGLFAVAWLEAARRDAAAAAQRAGETLAAGKLPFAIGDRLWPALAQSDLVAVGFFLALAAALFWVGRKRLLES